MFDQTNHHHNGETVDIADIKLEKNETFQEMSAIVDGEKVWFRFPLFVELEVRAELFLPPAMIEGMVRGIPVRVVDDIAISHRLSRGYNEIQGLLKNWNNDFIACPIIAKTTKDLPSTENVISCFSGGIDSTYTYGHFRDEITHLLVIQGHDDWKEGAGWAKNVINRQNFANKEGKKLITVETNMRHYCEARKFDYLLMFGSVLATIGVILNPKLFLIPSSATYSSLHPLGSHPLLDSLWQTDNTQIIHHDCAATRVQKTAFIAQFQDLTDQLQVCWNSSSDNCGICPKCLRTSITLKVLDKKSFRLSEPEGVEHYRKLVIKENNALCYVQEIIDLCEERDKTEIQQSLQLNVQAYTNKNSMHNVIKLLLGNFGRKIFRRYTSNPWYTLRATLISNRVK